MRFNRRKKKHYSTFASYDKPRRRREFKINWKILLWGGFFVLLFGNGFYLLVFSPFFQIKTIEISGHQILSAERIKSVAENYLNNKIFKFFPQNRLPVLAVNRLAAKITGEFPEIEKVEIKKNLPAKLIIKINERKATAIWCQAKPAPVVETPSGPINASSSPVLGKEKNILPESERCFFMDASGIIYREAPEMSGSLMPTFYSQIVGEVNSVRNFSGAISNGVKLKDEMVSAKTIEFAQVIKKDLRLAGIDVKGILLNNQNKNDLTVLTSEGWLVYFDLARPAIGQTRTLIVLLNEEIKEKRVSLEYVDLRIAGRAYYK